MHVITKKEMISKHEWWVQFLWCYVGGKVKDSKTILQFLCTYFKSNVLTSFRRNHNITKFNHRGLYHSLYFLLWLRKFNIKRLYLLKAWLNCAENWSKHCECDDLKALGNDLRSAFHHLLRWAEGRFLRWKFSLSAICIIAFPLPLRLCSWIQRRLKGSIFFLFF